MWDRVAYLARKSIPLRALFCFSDLPRAHGRSFDRRRDLDLCCWLKYSQAYQYQCFESLTKLIDPTTCFIILALKKPR